MNAPDSNIPSSDSAQQSADIGGSRTCDEGAGSATEQVGLELVREMRQRWRRGEQVAVEAFLAGRPELWQRPEAAVDLIYEEYCLRQAAGQQGVEDDILRRFPQWAGPLRVMLDCHRRVLQSDRDRPLFPGVGDCLGDFELLAELGRGSRGRVFLATQTSLADRPVVLKITPLDGAEHLSLARLQHTNIVPLYSVLDDAVRNVRILCMPYFGRATLASLLESLASVPFAARTGQHIVAAIDGLSEASDGIQERSSPPSATAGAAKQMLARISYVQAMCWITACLADALQFAHERGLVHLDLKPSNVLLPTDGQPMLLDLHLAREPIRPHGPLPENFGGTPPYMPPEQRIAMQSHRNGGVAEVTVDGRADIYALGAMLYESLGGQLPITAESPPLVKMNPQASAGLSDITAKCIALRPEDRYASAQCLADDLRRHLTDQPLVGVPNRSIPERWHKWRRRRPNMLRAAAAIVLVGAAAATLLAGAWSNMRDRQRQAELALRDGQRQLQSGRDVSEAVQTFERGLALAERVPLQGGLRGELRDQLVTARRLHLAQQLQWIADEIRVLYGTDSIPAERLRSLAGQCSVFWQKRDAIMGAPGSEPDPELAADLQEIVVFLASTQARVSPDSRSSTGGREASRLLDEAVEMFGPNAVLEYERQLYRERSGLTDAAASPARAVSLAPRTAWEHYALGRALLASGELHRAAGELDKALALEPAGRWPNFYYGVCASRMRRYEEAVTAFSVCIGTAPNVAGYFYNRAIAYAALGRPEQALRDYDRALEIDPTHAATALNRGVLHLQQGRLAEAMADLRLALEHGADAATVHYDLALVYTARRDRAAALRHARQALEHDPAHEAARQLRDTLEQRTRGPAGGD